MNPNFFGTFGARSRLSVALGAALFASVGFMVPQADAATTALTAAAQTPAVMANLSLGIGLTAHAVVPTGQTASIQSLTTTGTHGSVVKANATAVTYTPGSYYASLAKGATATDKFSYCLTDGAGASSCSTVTVTIFGAATAATTTPTSPTTPTTTAAYSCVRNWYVAQNGSDSAAGTSAATPWATIQHANGSGLLKAGDCVNIANGTYYLSSTAYLTAGGNANSATGYVVYRSTNSKGATFKPSAAMYDMINVQANYVIIDGLTVDGGNEGLVSNPMTTGHCIEGDGHHFQALNNLIHDCGGAAISTVYKDWYWIEGNTVYNNAFFNGYHTSGITIYEPRAVSYTATAADTSATYHIIVENNVSYDNGEKYVSTAHTDGNGIIMDDFQNSQSGNAAYPYKSLVQGNTSFGNGGRGIHLFYTNNVTVTGNVAYGNNQDTALNGSWRGELSNAEGSNNTWTNNQAAATSVPTDIRMYNTAVLDGHVSAATTGVTWSGNANVDTRTGGKSYSIDNATRAAAFPAANPLGKGL